MLDLIQSCSPPTGVVQTRAFMKPFYLGVVRANRTIGVQCSMRVFMTLP